MMRLVDTDAPAFAHGTVFRLPAKWPYENVVDFMVFDTADAARPFGLVVTTGYKAGLILVRLPAESVAAETGGLSAKWVIENWHHGIYPECPVGEVYVVPGYQPAALPVAPQNGLA
jgi:hypothetical protein